MSEGNSKTSTGIQQNSAGLLCYLGWWITGIIFFVLEKDNKFVRFHAVQSIIVFGIISIVLIVLSPLGIFIGFFRALTIIVDIIAFILWIITMVKAAQGQMFKLPWAGNLAEKYADSAQAQKTQQPPPAQQPPIQPNEEKKN
jgi:uncharacterized membrane protein